MVSIEPRDFLTRVYHAAVAAADPRRATRQAVAALHDLAAPVWLIAAGKGAHGMASGAMQSLRERNVAVAGGLVVSNAPDESATHGLEAAEGDHPTPGASSLAAADRLSALAASTTGDCDAIVLVSGGATSLIAGPVPGISEEDLHETFTALLASGADIALMNAVRKRLLRFGAGRLAMALNCRRVHCLIASDVLGNDPASIASGPCVPDRRTAQETRTRARKAGVWDALPANVRAHLDAMAEGRAPDVPPHDPPRFASTSVRVILDRTDADRGAARAAADLGATVEVQPEPLSGEAATAGSGFANQLLAREHRSSDCIIWSGETTVTLGHKPGRGGRCQEFALACAMSLDAAGSVARGITVLAAGTDGRDGPTDAAGAIVDSTTPSRIRMNGTDPASALHDHSSYDALQSAEALLKTGPTGTNVNDMVIALTQPRG
jgi:hydroxypyruvate reductase